MFPRRLLQSWCWIKNLLRLRELPFGSLGTLGSQNTRSREVSFGGRVDNDQAGRCLPRVRLRDRPRVPCPCPLPHLEVIEPYPSKVSSAPLKKLGGFRNGHAVFLGPSFFVWIFLHQHDTDPLPHAPIALGLP